MATCAGALAVLTLLDLVTPAVLLAMTFAMGSGAALMGPAWQAIQPDLVPPQEFSQAVALSSVTFNTGRTIGPALGGALVAAAGPGWAFVVNAASFVGVLIVLVGWRPEPRREHRPRVACAAAVRTGWRYGANAPALKGILVRTAAFAPAAAAVQALLPTVVRERLDLGSGSYGRAARLLRHRCGRGSPAPAPARCCALADRIVIVSRRSWSPPTRCSLRPSRTPWIVGAGLFVAGGAWTSATVTLNVFTQRALPWWVRARGLGLYMLVLAGGIAIGSAVWGGDRSVEPVRRAPDRCRHVGGRHRHRAAMAARRRGTSSTSGRRRPRRRW